MNNFANVVEMVDLATEGMVCLLAMKMLGIDSLEATLPNHTTIEELSENIVNEIWLEPGGGMILNVLTASEVEDHMVDEDRFCICGICKYTVTNKFIMI